MKTQILKIAIVIVLITSIFSCKSDDSNPITLADINYTSNTIDATFFQPGNSIPTINWNGDVGTFALIESYTSGIESLTVNEITGEISLTHVLPEGIWIFDIEATNSAGITIIEMTIDNTLQGVFTGTYDTTHFFEFEFFKNGTINIEADDVPYYASGTWTINNENIILVNYTYDIGGDEYSLKGLLHHSGASASYTGDYYWLYDAIPENISGVFDTSMDD
jgi:hypothetical protein